ncbi:hypothetical protein ABEV54_14955 [Peribacillus psychrosaccharolyticus]|uniref:hypothetical protein n=1 Tax=Peribacillus psychrosaccharolyticus TaxID=1407 RepID=UPI003D28EF6B
MKKNFIIYFYSLLIVLGIITALIVFKDFDGSIAIAFIIGFIILLSLNMFYFIFRLIVEVSKLRKWSEIRKILSKFIAYFVFLCILNYSFDKFLKSVEIDWYSIVDNSLVLSFALVAIDLVFSKKTIW